MASVLDYSMAYDTWCDHYDYDNNEMNTIHQYISFFQKDVLEIGCGTGRFTRKMLADNPASITAIDICSESLKIAAEKIKDKRVSFVCHDANDYLYFLNKKKRYDFVVFSWSIHKLNQIVPLLRGFEKLLNPNGAIVIISPVSSDYDYFMRCVRNYNNNNPKINQVIDYLHCQSNCIIDYITSSFSFNSIQEALRRNSFFWVHSNGNELENDEIKKILTSLSEFILSDGTVKIVDRVVLGIYYLGATQKSSNKVSDCTNNIPIDVV